MTRSLTPISPALADLGWTPFFAEQVAPTEAGLTPVRVSVVHRSRLLAETGAGSVKLVVQDMVMDFAVGDWVLMDPASRMAIRRLDRRTLLRRRSEGARLPQLIAANVDTLFIVTSCNDDFNPARLERYLAFANQAGVDPVIVLTKIDQVADAQSHRACAESLQRGLAVVPLNGKTQGAAVLLAPWCGPGRTVALVGSSGVGKSTLLNTLADKAADEAQATGGIREHDAKGRHTTTARSLHEIAGGGWVIDTPGMRTLQVSEFGVGLEMLFAEIAELAPNCRFRDCTHAHEPGCAVRAAVAAGAISADRLDRWRKLHEENRTHASGPPHGRPTSPRPSSTNGRGRR
ncbi:MAG: ribosome small subunit-dependent GTPase A [Paracoccaceae bacterium]